MNMGAAIQLIQIQSARSPDAESGTSASGFVETKDGTRCCECYSYREHDSCIHKRVIADPKVKKNKDGTAHVEDGNCCKFWWPKQ